MKQRLQEFIDFVKKQGVIGLAIGFLLGGAVSKLVTAFVNDIINPLLGLILGKLGNLSNYALTIGSAKILWGDFIAALIDFLVIALVVFYGFKILKLDKIDKKE
jgi:large conductance mechanosensitive channel